jgi:hypothetical protein
MPEVPNGSMLLGHLSQRHPTELGPILEQMRTGDMAQVAAQAFEVIEEPQPEGGNNCGDHP